MCGCVQVLDMWRFVASRVRACQGRLADCEGIPKEIEILIDCVDNGYFGRYFWVYK